MIKVPVEKVKEIWNLMKKAHVIWKQYYDEGLEPGNDWHDTYGKGSDIDKELSTNYGTPYFFFVDTIIHALKLNLTFDEYLKVCAAYGIEVVE